MNYVVARRVLVLPDEAIPLLLGDCFGKEQERLAATLFIMKIYDHFPGVRWLRFFWHWLPNFCWSRLRVDGSASRFI